MDLKHSGTLGMTWKDHKYIKKKNGNYYYEKKQSTSQTKDVAKEVLEKQARKEQAAKEEAERRANIQRKTEEITNKVADPVHKAVTSTAFQILTGRKSVTGILMEKGAEYIDNFFKKKGKWYGHIS